jgi:hypothetical protein
MQVDSFETLAPVLSSPLRKAERLVFSTRHLADKLFATNKSHDARIPDAEAVRFYALNQLMGVVQERFSPNEKLPEWAKQVAQAYHKELVAQHQRMVWYTFIVITREFRHLNSAATHLSKSDYPAELKGFHGKISDSTVESSLNKWLAEMPTMPLADYCAALTKQFDTGSYSGGYGGKPWGNIARTLYRYVAGETSAETFIDTAYTLAHNNGPMFNKGMMYGMYTSSFKPILDIQRSGQICEGIVEGRIKQMIAVPGMPELEAMINTVRKETGKISDHIDWYKVAMWAPDKASNPHKYDAEKAAQDKKYGKPQTKVIVDGKVVKIKAEFEVFPGQKVEIYERLAA